MNASPERLLLQGGYMLSMDEGVGEAVADVLIENGLITAIGTDLDVADAERVDVTGDVVKLDRKCSRSFEQIKRAIG